MFRLKRYPAMNTFFIASVKVFWFLRMSCPRILPQFFVWIELLTEYFARKSWIYPQLLSTLVPNCNFSCFKNLPFRSFTLLDSEHLMGFTLYIMYSRWNPGFLNPGLMTTSRCINPYLLYSLYFIIKHLFTILNLLADTSIKYFPVAWCCASQII